MSHAKLHTVVTKLAVEAKRPGGVTVGQAIKRAEAAMETMRGACVASLDDALKEIESKFGPTAKDRSRARFKELYRLASSIVDASIFLENTDLDKAARALCQLTALCETREAWDWVAVDLHVTALRLLRETGASLSPRQRQTMLAGLAQVTRKRVGDPDRIPDSAKSGKGI